MAISDIHNMLIEYRLRIRPTPIYMEISNALSDLNVISIENAMKISYYWLFPIWTINYPSNKMQIKEYKCVPAET